jgi:hypothetical protein
MIAAFFYPNPPIAGVAKTVGLKAASDVQKIQSTRLMEHL